MFYLLQLATVCFGCICVALSFGLFLHFRVSRKPIGRAVAFMLLGEAVGGAVTVFFSITAQGLLDVVTPWGSLVLRWLLFGTAFVTSIHLGIQTWRIEVAHDDDPDGPSR